jgi:uncharacterized protein (DUF433 family)
LCQNPRGDEGEKNQDLKYTEQLPHKSLLSSRFYLIAVVGMSWPERIVIDPEILAGKPVVRGTRLAVEFILELLAAGQSEAAILANYPRLTRDDILACLAYARPVPV